MHSTGSEGNKSWTSILFIRFPNVLVTRSSDLARMLDRIIVSFAEREFISFGQRYLDITLNSRKHVWIVL